MEEIDHFARHSEAGDEDGRPAIDHRFDATVDLIRQCGEQIDAEWLLGALAHLAHLVG